MAPITEVTRADDISSGAGWTAMLSMAMRKSPQVAIKKSPQVAN
jgi:hypothetical protein